MPNKKKNKCSAIMPNYKSNVEYIKKCVLQKGFSFYIKKLQD